MTRRPSVPVGVYLALVFISGLLVGAFGMRLYVVNSVSAREALPRPTAEQFRHKLMEDMQRRLHLRPDQVASINNVLDETRAHFREIHHKIDPEIKELRRQQSSQIRALLTSAQQPEYDRWHAEHEQPGH